MSPELPNVLVVEPDAERSWLIERILDAEGFPVTAVGGGLAAIRAAQHRRYALAIVATAMPGSLDGAFTLRFIRRGQPWLRALFTVTSAEAGRHNPDRDEFVAAPFRRNDLLGCVFELLQRPMATGSDHGCFRSR